MLLWNTILSPKQVLLVASIASQLEIRPLPSVILWINSGPCPEKEGQAYVVSKCIVCFHYKSNLMGLGKSDRHCLTTRLVHSCSSIDSATPFLHCLHVDDCPIPARFPRRWLHPPWSCVPPWYSCSTAGQQSSQSKQRCMVPNSYRHVRSRIASRQT